MSRAPSSAAVPDRGRRRLLGGVVAALGSAAAAAVPRPSRAAATAVAGWRLSPRLDLPDVSTLDLRAERRALAASLAGRVTAVQLMFTGCSTVCPLQGALFANLAQALDGSGVGLLSISIDSLGDSPKSLDAWLSRYGRHPSWTGAIVDAADVDRLSAFLRGHPVKPGTHSRQVFVFDRDARLAGRTEDDPSGRELARLLQDLALRG